MKLAHVVAGLGILGLALTGCATPSEMPENRASIHFADLGGIRDWRPADGDALLVQGRNGDWYRATFFNRCSDVRFADTIAFITEPTGELDRYSSIIARGNRCWFRTFERVEEPLAMD